QKQSQQGIQYMIPTIIQTPRPCFIPNHLPKHSDFFTFPTNHLTQFTFRFSTHHAPKFINLYTQNNILHLHPFQTLH
ncbi:putative PEP-binding protein, partial [Staphylococcus epidermidis]|uniref:putative PEP-binding protein n=1 Tax=Staphylococcus epidermidis TaxID=1282 RepID=UPI00119F71F5